MKWSVIYAAHRRDLLVQCSLTHSRLYQCNDSHQKNGRKNVLSMMTLGVEFSMPHNLPVHPWAPIANAATNSLALDMPLLLSCAVYWCIPMRIVNAVGACGWVAMLAAEPAHQTKVTAPVSNESFKALSFVSKNDVMENLEIEIGTPKNFDAGKWPSLQYSICQHVSPLSI